MLLIQVPLWAWTGRAETSALKTLSAGNKEQLVPGSGCAWTGGAWDGVSASSPRTSETPHVPLGRISLSTTRAGAQVAGPSQAQVCQAPGEIRPQVGDGQRVGDRPEWDRHLDVAVALVVDEARCEDQRGRKRVEQQETDVAPAAD